MSECNKNLKKAGTLAHLNIKYLIFYSYVSLITDTKDKSVPGGINMDLPKGACFREFYYRGLYCETSQELEEYIKKNKWYFDRVKPEIQEQFRKIYKDLKRREAMKTYGEKDRCKRDY